MKNDTSEIVITPKTPFFRRVDWSSFWTATIISFIVYFLTASPSVTLEDAGELAVAGDYLGVPHPPGYPIWTICAWIFSRILSFVTFRGQPNPAWAIAVMSGFFGALATGMTAMLITRTASDMLRDMEDNEEKETIRKCGSDSCAGKRRDILGWVGGVAGSLIFAFSPVMWSQATIVEVYTLNAFFLMWIFLLSYRWMRRPSDKILWLTAFVFGLGLTNYQVLLFVAVPLIIIIFLRNISLFRDFILVTIPFLLTMGIMKLGAMVPQYGFNKLTPLYDKYPGMDFPPVVESHYYWFVFVILAALLIACGYFGVMFRIGKIRKDDNAAAIAIMSVLGIALLISLAVVPSAPSVSVPSNVPAAAVFSWIVPSVFFLFMLAVLWAFALFVPGGVWFALAVTCIEVSLGVLLRKGALLGLTHPLSFWFWIYLVLNFAVLALAWILLPNGRSVSLTFIAAEAGVAFYGYMPIVSDMNPPMNWGYPRTWDGFKHAVTRGQYEKIAPVTIQQLLSPTFVKQIGSYFTDLRTQFTLLLAPLGFIPFAAWQFRARGRRVRGFTYAFAMTVLVALLAVLDRIINPDAGNFGMIYKVPMALVLLFSAVGLFLMLLTEGIELAGSSRSGAAQKSDRIVAFVCLTGLALILMAIEFGISNIAAESLLDFWKIPEPAVGAAPQQIAAYRLKSYPLTVVMAFALFAVQFGIYLTTKRERGGLHLRFDATARQWFIATMAGFLMMSIVLIGLAKPKGDLQDAFIQKVKFISSHGLFAVWIGYGISFGLAALHQWLRPLKFPRAVWYIILSAALAAAAIPVYENYTNERLVFEMSAADQTLHDFGWQFGNYQLRGADAVSEELSSDEEPLPNPDYPPEMTTNAVFFGGTDPGRFVPTYMIFSAKVRPDVLLITQNALADPTYMDTMRDMYGDHIWMPGPKDNQSAFSRYIDEVNTGKRPNYGDIRYEGGRVQVTGALAVMEINGFLTEQIFMKNRDLHDFYVEESYTLRWMFQYLSPHGLIMKINHDGTALSSETVNRDMDFWDWYTRRLLNDPKFRRDLPAEKSFSKLRGAIAGLYSFRRMDREAERAFREARALYRVSPEANLRLIQENLLQFGRFDECIEILEELVKKDPNNDRFPDILAQIVQTRDKSNRLNEIIEKYNKTKSLSVDEVFEATECYISTGRNMAAAQFLRSAIQNQELSNAQKYRAAMLFDAAGSPADASVELRSIPDADLSSMIDSDNDYIRISAIHKGAGKYEYSIRALVQYLQKHINDYAAWLDLCTMNLILGRNEQATEAMIQAQRRGGSEAMAFVQKSKPLRDFYEYLVKRQEETQKRRKD